MNETVQVEPKTSDHSFFIVFAIAILIIVAVGFGRSYVAAASEMSRLVHVHALVSGVWVALFVAQVWLAAGRSLAVHRQVGVAAAILALAVVAVGYATAIEGARTGWVGPRFPRNLENATHFLFVPLGNLLWFAVFVGLALHRRSTPETHKRLMVLAMLGGLMPPALARLPRPAEPLLILMLVIGPLVFERWRYGRVHPVFKWGMAVLVATIPVTILVSRSTAWDAVARWLIG